MFGMNLFGLKPSDNQSQGEASKVLKDILQIAPTQRQVESSPSFNSSLINRTGPPSSYQHLGAPIHPDCSSPQLAFPIKASVSRVDSKLQTLPKSKQKVFVVDKKVKGPAMDSVMVTLGNNSTIELDEKEKENYLTIFAPSLGSGDVIENTNSNFCKVSKLIDYNWEKLEHVNFIAVHHSEPIVAYVINVGYSRKVNAGKFFPPSLPSEQAVRILNYQDQNRGIIKESFLDTITDLSFAYGTTSADINKLALVDRSSNVYIFSYALVQGTGGTDKTRIEMQKMLIITAPTTYKSCKHAKLSWCPYIPSDEPSEIDQSLKFAVTADNHIQVFSLNRYADKVNESLTVANFNQDKGEYYAIHNAHTAAIISVAISNDGSAICVAFSDNVIKFYQLATPENNQVLRTWAPDLGAQESISYFCFLDDLDYLLTHPDHHFWGYVFIGTKKGTVSLWDLRSKKWNCVQKITIECEEDDLSDEPFTYQVDSSSKVILAIRKMTAFVILLDFSEKKVLNGGGSETEEEEEVFVPKIKQIARFQVYNPILSFCVKKTKVNNKEIEIFWITQKSLERCTIDVDNLQELKIAGRTIRSSNKKIKPNEQKINKSPVKADVVSTPPNHFGNLFNSIVPSSIPPATLTPNIVNISSNAMSSIMSPLTKTPEHQREQELLSRVQATSMQLQALKRQESGSKASGQDKPATASSANNSLNETTNLMDTLNLNLETSLNDKTKESTPITPCILPFRAAPPLIPTPLSFNGNNDFIRNNEIDNRITLMENKLQQHFNEFTASTIASISAVKVDITDLKLNREEFLERDKRLTETIIEKVVAKSMSQLNSVVSEGLKDFFDQVKSEVDGLQKTVIDSVTKLDASHVEVGTQMNQLQQKMEIFQKQLEKNEAEQQLILYRFQQHSAQLGLAHGSPYRL